MDVCLAHEPYRLVLLDNSMPLLNGIEVAQIVRQMQEKGELSQITKLALISGDNFDDNQSY